MMMSTIELKRAARLAGVTPSQMRDIASDHSLEPRAASHNFGKKKLDSDAFYKWLSANSAREAAAREEEKELQYQDWLEANGEFLRRFLAEERE